MRVHEDNIRGAVLGLAYGDALGYPNEFMSHQEILKKSHTRGPSYKISDDTQMSIYLMLAYLESVETFGDALVNIDHDEYMQHVFTLAVARQFSNFYHDPDNDRAPGITCMNAIKKFMDSPRMTGLEGSVMGSKGCGANMRCGWLGLLPYADEDLAVMAILQSKVTHGHPDALLSSALTTLIVRHLAKDKIRPSIEGSLIRHAIQLLDTQKFYNQDQLLEPTKLRTLLTEALIVLPEFVYSDPGEDICSYFNMSGNTADEALVLAIATADAYADNEDTLAGIQRLAESGGDSDSIAAIGGCLIGAHRGAENLLDASSSLIELEPRYADELEEIAQRIIEANAVWTP